MRPYLAVLKDSFREALASRVLWILIFVTTVVLALLAPLGFKEQPLSQSPLSPEAAQPGEPVDADEPDDEKPPRKEQMGISLTYFTWAAAPYPMTRAQAVEEIKTGIANIIYYFVGI